MNDETKLLSNSHYNNYDVIAGIDWADNKHDISLFDPKTGVSRQLVIQHQVENLNEFVTQLKRDFPGKIAVLIEQRRGPMINFLLSWDNIDIFPIDPNKLASFRASIYPSGTKNDRIDSQLMVEYFVKHGQHLGTPLQPDTSEVRELAFLNEDRRTIVDERTKCIQKMGAALKQYYPLALEVFDDLTTEIAAKFLKKWPSFDTLKSAKASTIRSFFYANGSRSKKKIEQRIELIENAKTLTTDAAVIHAMSRKVMFFAKEILLKAKEIKAYEQRIQELYKKQEESALFGSLPGAGDIMEPRLMVIFGTNRGRYRDAQSVTEYTGIAPVTKETGESKKTKRKSRQVLFRRGAPKFLRQSLVEYAGCTVQYCNWAKAFYKLKSEQGKEHNTILRALAIKWTRIIYRCWQQEDLYDDEKYLTSLRKSNSPIIKKMEELELIDPNTTTKEKCE